MSDLVFAIRLSPSGSDFVGELRIPRGSVSGSDGATETQHQEAANRVQRLDRADDGVVRDKWPRTLVDLVDVATNDMKHAGINPNEASRCARISVGAIARYHGGRVFYLPRGEALEQALRNQQIWQEFTGDNVQALVAKFKLSDKQIYQVLNQHRQLRRERADRAENGE